MNINKSHIALRILLLICVISYIACVDEFDSEASTPMIFVYSELELGEGIDVFVSQSSPFLSVSSINTPVEEANVLLNENGASVKLDFDTGSNCFIDLAYEITEGNTYGIDVTIPQSATPDVQSFVTVPFFRSPVIEAQFISINSQDDMLISDIQMTVPGDLAPYHELEITAHILKEVILSDGSSTFVRDDSATRFRISTDDTSVKNLVHRPSALYELPSMEDGNIINLRLEAKVELSTNDRIDSISVISRTVTEEYYSYHSTLSNQIELEVSGAGEPVLNYSNIMNGIGLFGARSSRKRNIVVQ